MRREKAEFKVHSLNLDKSEPPDHASSKTQTRTASFIIHKHDRAQDKPTYKGPLNKHVKRNHEQSHKQNPISY